MDLQTGSAHCSPVTPVLPSSNTMITAISLGCYPAVVHNAERRAVLDRPTPTLADLAA